MPWYNQIREDTPEGRRTLERLVVLRRELDRQIPGRRDDRLILATWNIREFDSRAYGTRQNEPLQYIAEIVARFDIVAITEVRSNLWALSKLLRLLGSEWRYVVTDITGGRAGNRERLAVVYDSNKVAFGGLAGELVLPPVETTDAAGERLTLPAAQFARTPLMAGFRSKWVDFQLALFHVIWGSDVGQRREEVRQLTAAITEKADDPNSWSRNMVVLGDFNLGSPNDEAWQALRDAGWVVPADFEQDIRGTNIAQDRYYDQIAVRPRPGFFEIEQIAGAASAGAFNFYDVVYRPLADFETYRGVMDEYQRDRNRSNFRFDSRGNPRTPDSQRNWYRRYWRTHQMSDHLPLWVAIRSDNTDAYLTSRLA